MFRSSNPMNEFIHRYPPFAKLSNELICQVMLLIAYKCFVILPDRNWIQNRRCKTSNWSISLKMYHFHFSLSLEVRGEMHSLINKIDNHSTLFIFKWPLPFTILSFTSMSVMQCIFLKWIRFPVFFMSYTVFPSSIQDGAKKNSLSEKRKFNGALEPLVIVKKID